MLTKVALNQVESERTGAVRSERGSLSVQSDNESTVAVLYLAYDQMTGTLILEVPGIGKVRAEGFLTASGIGVGKTGRTGGVGKGGLDGLIGDDGGDGDIGCPGVKGVRGVRGYRGPDGPRGFRGHTGSTGAAGKPGRDCKLLVFVCSEDPGPVGASALWIKPMD